MIEKICFVCKKKFTVYRYREFTAKFCSRKCGWVWRKETINSGNGLRWKGGKITLSCLHCQKEFKVDQYRRNTAKYCSRSCEMKYINTQARIQSWSREYKMCKKCKTSRFPHEGKGLCKKCYSRKNKYANRYGLSIEEFEAFEIQQNGRCNICNQVPVPDTLGRTLNIDHDHITGKIRGLLCSPCNTALGLLKDNIDYLHSAIKYLDPSLAQKPSSEITTFVS